VYVYRQRLGNLVDSGAHLCADVYDAGVPSGVCANLFRVADSSVIPLAPVSPFVPLFLGFLQRYKPEAKLGTYYSLVLPYPLIFLGVWLVMLVAWYLVGLPIGPGIYPRLH
jgi:p-aminobenzoyl-glutamate transporter AbgT